MAANGSAETLYTTPLKSMVFALPPDIAKSGGVIVRASKPGTYPSPDDSEATVAVGPGSETTIMLRESIYHAKSTEPSPCVQKHEPVEFVNILKENGTITFPYSKWTCLSEEKSQQLTSRCNCSYIGFPILASMRGKYPFCFDMNLLWNRKISMQQFREQQMCALRVIKDLEQETNSTCRSKYELCTRSKYAASAFSSDWPISTMTNLISEWYIDPTITGMKSRSLVPRALNVIKETFESQKSNPLLQLQIVRENFLSIDIQRETQTATISTEDLAYPLANLFSDIGGILGLYLGASLLSLVDFAEFLFQLYRKISIVKVHSDSVTNEAEKDI